MSSGGGAPAGPPPARPSAGLPASGGHRGLPGDPLGGQVHDQAAEPDPGLVLGRPGAPDRGPHAGEQLLHSERLGDVVVRSRVERLDLVGAVGSPGQHDDGRLGPAAQALDHLHAFQVGQAEVEDHQVGRVPGGHLERLGPGGRHVHLVLAHPQVDAQRAQDLRLVVDDQHPGHGAVPPAVSSAASRSRWPGSQWVVRLRRDRHRHGHGQPAAGSVLGGQRPAHRLGQAARQRQAEPHPGRVVGVAQPLERHEHPVPFLLRDAGAAVDHAQLDPVSEGAGGQQRRLVRR